MTAKTGGAAKSTTAWSRRDTVALSIATALGLVARVAYLSGMEWAPYDPWRHLALVRNLQGGLGFVLFEGQPYVWYQPPWYWLCALLAPVATPDRVAAFLSLLCVPLTFVWLRAEAPRQRWFAATAGALLMAAYGPLVKFTCHFGPEAFALALLLGGLVLMQRPAGWRLAGLAGFVLAVGLVARLNYIFAIFLVLPWLRSWPRTLAFGAGAAVPLGLAWIRNFTILKRQDWVFTWDGLATRTELFNPVSVLVPQLHPDVGEGLTRLHAKILPTNVWLEDPLLLAFLTLAAVGSLIARRPGPALSFYLILVYLLAFDATGTGHFFRIWLGAFPAIFAAIALGAARISGWLRGGPVVAWIPIAIALLLGLPFVTPVRGAAATLHDTGTPLVAVTPPAGLLTADRYFVNSTYYHPASVVYRYPDKRFLGLPLRAKDFPDLQRAFPDYRHVLWHGFSVQDEVYRYLLDSGRYEVQAQARNENGLLYVVLRARDGVALPDATWSTEEP